MAFSYNLSTSVGQVRLLVADTDPKDHIFTDEELSAFLTMVGSNIFRGAAEAYGAIIRSRALLSDKIKREGYESQEHALQDMRQLVKDLEQKAISVEGLQTSDFLLTDEHFEQFRPGWRAINQEVVM